MWVLAVASLVNAPACSSPKSSSRPEAAAVSTTPATVGASGPAAATDGPALTFGPGPFNLPDPSVGLDQLAGYSATLTVAFDGTRDGSAEQWQRDKAVVVDLQQGVRQLTVTRTGAETGNSLRLDIAGTRFEQSDDGPCVASALEAELSDPDDPTAALPGLLGAESAGTEEVNGVPTTHYSFDARAFGSIDTAAVKGDVWVADSNGVVVRYRLVVDGTAAYLGTGVKGTMTLDYELTATDQPAVVVVPADCPPGVLDLPLPATASDTVAEAGYTTYNTTDDVDVVRGFYEQLLGPLGWLPEGDPMVVDDFVELSFRRDTDRLQVTIESNDTGRTVTLVVIRDAN